MSSVRFWPALRACAVVAVLLLVLAVPAARQFAWGTFTRGTVITAEDGGFGNAYQGTITLKDGAKSVEYSRSGNYTVDEGAQVFIGSSRSVVGNLENSKGHIRLVETIRVGGHTVERTIDYYDGRPKVVTSAKAVDVGDGYEVDLTQPYPKLQQKGASALRNALIVVSVIALAVVGFATLSRVNRRRTMAVASEVD